MVATVVRGGVLPVCHGSIIMFICGQRLLHSQSVKKKRWRETRNSLGIKRRQVFSNKVPAYVSSCLRVSAPFRLTTAFCYVYYTSRTLQCCRRRFNGQKIKDGCAIFPAQTSFFFLSFYKQARERRLIIADSLSLSLSSVVLFVLYSLDISAFVCENVGGNILKLVSLLSTRCGLYSTGLEIN